MVERDYLFASGHGACLGCGQAIAVRLVLRATGENVIVVSPTGCLEIFSSNYPYSAWQVPWIHSLFENAPAVASGVERALKALKRDVPVVVIGGDGGIGDIGFQALSGMLERGHNVLVVCMDNEAYMNTGIQRSGLTPLWAATTTSPPGKLWKGNWRPKKNLPEIVASHNIPYVATASVHLPFDLDKKVKKALSFNGPKYIHILCPCPLGWGYNPELTIDIARLAVDSGLFPLIEQENGKLIARKIGKKKPVEEYLKLQGRFRHITEDKEAIGKIQAIADANITKYNL